MLQFIKYTFATILGVTLFVGVLILVVFAFIPDDEVTIESNSVLRLTLSKPILERSIENPLADLDAPVPVNGVQGMGLVEIKKMLHKAKVDPKIKGIFLHLSGVSSGFASLEEIREALLDFKKSEKFIYAYGEAYSEGAYYLASIADKIYLNPNGVVEFNGLLANIPYFKGAMDKLNVKPVIFKVGEFKSAYENYTLDAMSEPNRKQIGEMINGIYDFYLKNVAESRGVGVAKLREVSNKYLAEDAEAAKKHKLVTDIAYYDQVLKDMKKELALEEDEDIEFVGSSKYGKVASSEKTNSSRNRIAVIIAQGEIVMGEGGDNIVGSDKIAREIRKAREDKKVKGIVIRVNSPGGSALASDVMWREITLAKKEKPVIASMSDVAASGGYYMAMGCDEILAHPNTITGSIGVVGLFFNVQDLTENRLGIRYDQVGTGAYSSLDEIRTNLMTRAFSEKEQALIQRSINQVYEDFTAKAAQGRNMSQDDIKKIAEGRVWTGIQAKELGLIDDFGNLEDAIALAAKKAELEEGDYRVRYYPLQKDFFQKILSDFTKNTQTPEIPEYVIKEKLGIFYPYLKMFEQMKKRHYLQARMPYEINIR